MTKDNYHFSIPMFDASSVLADEELAKKKEEILKETGFESSSTKGGAIKNDAKKPRMSLVPILAKKEVARVMSKGAKKYKAYNWCNGFEYTVLADAAERHIDDWRCGQDIDPDSGEHPLAHAVCSLMMLLENILVYGDKLDDRWEGWKTPEGKCALEKTHRPLIVEPKKNDPTK